MEKILLSSNLFSHPGKLLENHLLKVGELAYNCIKEAPLEPIFRVPKEIIANIAKIEGLCHDIGKSTGFFQKYLFAMEDEKAKLKVDPRSHHSYLSAIIGFKEAVALSKSINLNGEMANMLAFHTYWAIKRHHSNLEDLEVELTTSKEDLKILLEQIESIDSKKLYALSDILVNNGLPLAFSKEVLKEYVLTFESDLRESRRIQKRAKINKGLEGYLFQNLLFSSLIDADKLEVAIANKPERNKTNLADGLIDSFKNSKFSLHNDNPINSLRNDAYRDVLKSEPDLSQKILSINLPTGLGKTLISFAYAFKLKERLSKEKGFEARIIYSLPFLSIIDQNFDVIKSVLESNNIKVDSSLLLEHHHLSDVKYILGDNEFEPENSKILIEGWNSEIIITTFVQLFETIFSNRNSYLRKFSKLSGSIIILDEIQAIPVKYWKLLNDTLQILADKFNTYIILLTATKPLVFREGMMLELSRSSEYFKKIDRTTIKSEIDDEINLERFVNSLSFDSGKRYLFIFNTINCAKNFYLMLREILPEEDIAFLSSHITPYERLLRINSLNKENIRFAVTTQLIEAGVDIDFDVIYRDIAPLDSIIQAAGRCNRNWHGRGFVTIINLKDERRQYASYVYDGFLIDATKRVLKEHPIIKEPDLYAIINEYYHILKNKISFDASTNLIEALEKLKYTSPLDGKVSISSFSLIEDDGYKMDVFVEINNEAKKAWNEFNQIMCLKNIFERRNRFESIKKDFYNFVISVPKNSKSLPPIINGFGYINFDSLQDLYDRNTGFKPNGNFIW
jgi:CRISPR-associated endonuclease/helicase Cas3